MKASHMPKPPQSLCQKIWFLCFQQHSFTCIRPILPASCLYPVIKRAEKSRLTFPKVSLLQSFSLSKFCSLNVLWHLQRNYFCIFQPFLFVLGETMACHKLFYSTWKIIPLLFQLLPNSSSTRVIHNQNGTKKYHIKFIYKF